MATKKDKEALRNVIFDYGKDTFIDCIARLDKDAVLTIQQAAKAEALIELSARMEEADLI